VGIWKRLIFLNLPPLFSPGNCWEGGGVHVDLIWPMAYHSIQYIALGSTRLVDVFCNLPALAVCWKSLLTAVAAEIFRLYTAQLLNCLNVVSSLELSVPSFSSVLLDMTDGSYFGLLRPRRKYNKKRTA